MLVNPISFRGEIGRLQYLCTLAASLAVILAIMYAAVEAQGIRVFDPHLSSPSSHRFSPEAARVFSLTAAATFLVIFSLLVRRIRDFHNGRGAWMAIMRWGTFICVPMLAFLQIFSPIYEGRFFDGSLNSILLAMMGYAAFAPSGGSGRAKPHGSPQNNIPFANTAAHRAIYEKGVSYEPKRSEPNAGGLRGGRDRATGQPLGSFGKR